MQKVDREERKVWGGMSQREGWVEEGDGTLPIEPELYRSFGCDSVHNIEPRNS
jgi:hypothetical protein